MRVSYQEWFRLQCRHDYFSDGVCRALDLRPSVATQRMLERYRLRFRPDAGGGAVYYSEPELLRQYRESTPFAFVVTSSDRWLDVYTDSEVGERSDPSETVRYFSNRETHAAQIDGEQQLLLHPPGQPFAQPPLPVRSPVFTYRFEGPVHAARLQVSDALTGRTLWETHTPAQDVGAWTIDLREQPQGRCRLDIDGTPALDFYLSDTPAVRVWGVLEIFAGGPELAAHIPSAAQVIDAAGAPLARTFDIALSARKTVWRYCIFDPQDGPTHDGDRVVAVSKRNGEDGSAAAIRFVRNAATIAYGGRPATVFESDRAIALSESPGEQDYAFVFKPGGQAPRGARTIKLPFAQPAATRLDDTGGTARMCSDIFVYW